MSNKFETKKIFWKIVDTITENKDLWLKNKDGEIEEEGKVLPSGASATFGLKTGSITIYDKNMNTVFIFDENSNFILFVRELLEQVEDK